MAAASSPPTQTSELLRRLRHDLLAGALAPDLPLRMPALRERYGAGLTPLREALFQLVAEGLVRVEDQRGFRAAPVSHDDLHDLTQQRVLLEGRAIRVSIEHGDLAWESRVVAAHHRLSGAPILAVGTGELNDEWSHAHGEFHVALFDACGSPWLLRFADLLSDHAERYRRYSIHRERDRDVAGEHRDLADAVLARDVETALLRLQNHYWRTARLCELPVGGSQVAR